MKDISSHYFHIRTCPLFFPLIQIRIEYSNDVARKLCDAFLTEEIRKRAPPTEVGDKGQNQPSKKQLRRERAEQKRLIGMKNKKQKTAVNADGTNDGPIVQAEGEDNAVEGATLQK